MQQSDLESLETPPGWVAAVASERNGVYAVQLIHESLLGKSDAKITVEDRPGWVRGIGGSLRAALDDATSRARNNPPVLS